MPFQQKLSPSHCGCCSGALSGSLARWLRPPTGSVSSVFGKGRSPLLPTPTWEPQIMSSVFFAELSAEIHPEGQGLARGPIHHKKSCFHFPGRGDENKQNKRAGTLPAS